MRLERYIEWIVLVGMRRLTTSVCRVKHVWRARKGHRPPAHPCHDDASHTTGIAETAYQLLGYRRGNAVWILGCGRAGSAQPWSSTRRPIEFHGRERSRHL